MKALEQRPPLRRWLFAALAAWIAAAGIPIIWFWLMSSGGSGLSILFGVAWTVILGLPLAFPGLLVLTLLAWLGFSKLRSWPWLGWAGLGLSIGALCVILFSISIASTVEDMGNPVIVGALSGSAIAGVVFRWLLLAKADRS